MKNLILLLLVSFLSVPLFSQDNLCESSYMPFNKGVKLEYTNYNAKGKETGRQEQNVSQLTAIDDGFKATIEFTVFDAKGKEVSSGGSFDIECQDGTVKMDMSKMINPELLESYNNMDAEITGENIQFPNNPKEGQSLPDGTMDIKASMGGIGSMNTSIRMVNRKVEGFEKVTTPAGTYDCVKISQETEMKMMGINRSSKSVNWLAKGIGTVKTENYNAKGKLESSMLLTRLE